MPWGQWLDRSSFSMLLLSLFWAPVPLASNRRWALALLACMLAIGLLLAALSATLLTLSAPSKKRLHAGPPWLALGAAAGFCMLIAAQVIGATQFGIETTLDAYQTRQYLLTTLTYFAAMGLVVWSARTPRRILAVLGTVLATGLFQATVAIVLNSSGATYNYLFTEFQQGGRASGTFASADHLAGYMQLSLAAGLGLMLAQFSTQTPGGRGAGWRFWLSQALNFVMSGKMLLRLALVVLVVALVLTRSRMGNGAFFLSLALIGALVAMRSQRLRRPALWLVASMALVDILIIGQWIGLEHVVQRMQATAESSSNAVATFGLSGPPPRPTEESLAQRMEVPRLSLQLVAEKPWFGHGAGSYRLAFEAIKPADVYGGHWDHAHNDYVQVAVDTGLVGVLLWVAIGALTACRALRALADDQPRLTRGVGVAALMAISCIGLHGMVDFNLHIPANSLTFSVLLALVWNAPYAYRAGAAGAGLNQRPMGTP